MPHLGMTVHQVLTICMSLLSHLWWTIWQIWIVGSVISICRALQVIIRRDKINKLPHCRMNDSDKKTSRQAGDILSMSICKGAFLSITGTDSPFKVPLEFLISHKSFCSEPSLNAHRLLKGNESVCPRSSQTTSQHEAEQLPKNLSIISLLRQSPSLLQAPKAACC